MDEKLTSILLSTIDPKYHNEARRITQEESRYKAVLDVFNKFWSDSDKLKAKHDFNNKVTHSPFYKLMVTCYDTQAHFNIVDSHRGFIRKSYQRLKHYFPEVTEEQIANHDLSKYSFEQTIGYTARWIHNVEHENPVWQKSLRLHYDCEPHHPEYYYPAVREMPEKFLEESVIDMVASRWERQLHGRADVTNAELVDFDSVYLKRYSDVDRQKVEQIILKVKTGEVR